MLAGLSLQRTIFDPMRGKVLAGFFLHHRFVIGSVAEVHLISVFFGSAMDKRKN